LKPGAALPWAKKKTCLAVNRQAGMSHTISEDLPAIVRERLVGFLMRQTIETRCWISLDSLRDSPRSQMSEIPIKALSMDTTTDTSPTAWTSRPRLTGCAGL